MPQPHRFPFHRDIYATEVAPHLRTGKNTFSLHTSFSFIPQSQAASDYQDASAYLVIDADTGKVIADKNMSESLPIASLTKIMTAMVVLDLARPTDLITVSQAAQDVEPTRIGVISGEQLTVEELLNGMLLTSGNDAAQALKDGLDQKFRDEVFIRAMNDKTKIIGLKNTHYSNPQGFDSPENYSSVADLALASKYAIAHYPLLADIVKKDFQHLNANQYHHAFDLINWNGLIDVYPDTTGVKIGNTDAAQTTMVALSHRAGKNILAVVLGAPTILRRDLWASQLLDLGYETALNLPPVNVTEEQLQTKYGSWYQ